MTRNSATASNVAATALACSALNANTICDCELFCVVNTNANAYYTALNEMFNNYTRYNDIAKVNYNNIGFSGMVFLSSVLNFKSPGSTNENLETVS
jgi:hypothetical protein